MLGAGAAGALVSVLGDAGAVLSAGVAGASILAGGRLRRLSAVALHAGVGDAGAELAALAGIAVVGQAAARGQRPAGAAGALTARGLDLCAAYAAANGGAVAERAASLRLAATLHTLRRDLTTELTAALAAGLVAQVGIQSFVVRAERGVARGVGVRIVRSAGDEGGCAQTDAGNE